MQNEETGHQLMTGMGLNKMKQKYEAAQSHKLRRYFKLRRQTTIARPADSDGARAKLVVWNWQAAVVELQIGDTRIITPPTASRRPVFC